MTFGTLIFGRVRFDIVTVTDENGTSELDADQAKIYHQNVLMAPWRDYEAAVAARQEAVAKFIESATVHSYEEAVREWDAAPRRLGFHKGPAPDPVDQVRIGDEAHHVPAGTAQDFLGEEAARRFPDPPAPDKPADYSTWFSRKKHEKRTWQATFVTDSDERPIELGSSLSWPWGFPVAAALRELNRLERDGWMLVHVSEDHGLYAGADATDEAYLTRVRYLLARPAA
jgi:hypothetical protein